MFARLDVVDGDDAGVAGGGEAGVPGGEGDCSYGFGETYVAGNNILSIKVLELRLDSIARRGGGFHLPDSEYFKWPTSLLNTYTLPLWCPLAVKVPSGLRSTHSPKLPAPAPPVS